MGKTQEGEKRKGKTGEEGQEKGKERETAFRGLSWSLPESFHRPELLTCKLLSLYSCLFFPPKAGFVSVD